MPIAIRYVSLAIRFIKSEIETFHLVLKHPQLSASEHNTTLSPLFWSKDFAAIALSENLCAYSFMGAIETSDGKKAPFSLIVEHFEKYLNIKLGNPDDIKRRVLGRKIKLTDFSDSMRHSIIEMSKK